MKAVWILGKCVCLFVSFSVTFIIMLFSVSKFLTWINIFTLTEPQSILQQLNSVKIFLIVTKIQQCSHNSRQSEECSSLRNTAFLLLPKISETISC